MKLVGNAPNCVIAASATSGKTGGIEAYNISMLRDSASNVLVERSSVFYRAGFI